MDIAHRLYVKTKPEVVYKAVSTVEGISGFFAPTTGNVEVDEVITITFDQAVMKMKVIELEPPHTVKWQCVELQPEWIDTKVTFSIMKDKNGTAVDFWHTGWKSETVHYRECNIKWAIFLASLREYCETGTGRPYPNDIQV